VVTLKCTVKFDRFKLDESIKLGNREALRQAGYYIRGIARRSIKVSDYPSDPGQPPHSRVGKIKNAILSFADDVHALIGPGQSAIGIIGQTHEFGGMEPPKLPPALRKNNWRLWVGGHGPIRYPGAHGQYAKIKTMAQLERVMEIAAQVLALDAQLHATDLHFFEVRWKDKERHYPARPFMGPALEISRDRLPALWSGQVKN
jgi:hypothetical protein